MEEFTKGFEEGIEEDEFWGDFLKGAKSANEEWKEVLSQEKFNCWMSRFVRLFMFSIFFCCASQMLGGTGYYLGNSFRLLETLDLRGLVFMFVLTVLFVINTSIKVWKERGMIPNLGYGGGMYPTTEINEYKTKIFNNLKRSRYLMLVDSILILSMIVINMIEVL